MGEERGGTLSVQLLGGFGVRRDDAQPIDVRSHASRSLISYLALHRDRPATRSLVCGSLWPDESELSARARLRHALHQSKLTLGTDIFIRSGDTLELDANAINLDIDAFTDAIELAAAEPDARDRIRHLERAVEMYAGDLLHGYYDHPWADIDRESFRRRYLGALDRLCELHSAAGRDESALAYARRLAAEDRWNERAHRRVMWLAASSGRVHEAIHQYEICRTILDEDLGADPSIETQDLYESIVHDRERTRAITKDGPLIGRDHERSTAARLLDSVALGAGSVLLIEGDTGVGKTRLIQTVVNDATWRGFDVIEIRGHPGQRPYGAIAPAIEAIDSQLLEGILDGSSLNRVQSIVTPSDATTLRRDERAEFHNAAATALAAPSKARPLLVAVDDIHTIDAASASSIALLGELSRSERVVLVVSYRHDQARSRREVWENLTTLDRIPGRTRMALSPLSPGQTEDLARSLVGYEIDPQAATDLHHATGGLPSLIVESLRHPDRTEDLDAIADAIGALAGQFVAARTSELSAGALETLRILALVEGPCDEALLAAIDAIGVRDLISCGLAAHRGGGVEPTSELIRRSIVRDIPTEARGRLHARIGEAMEHAAPDSVLTIAHHFAAAGETSRASPYLVTAAQQAASLHEYDTAVEYYRAAMPGLEDRTLALRSMVEILDLVGRRDEMADALDALEEIAVGPDAIDALLHRAHWLSQGGDLDAARRHGRKALAAAHDLGDIAREVAALASLAMVECRAGDAAAGAAHLDTAAGFGGLGRREQAAARNALGQNLVDLGRFEEAETQLLAAQALFRDLSDTRGEVDVIGMLAAIRMQQGNAQEAADRYLEAIELSRRIGYREGEAKGKCNLGTALIIGGEAASGLNSLDEGADLLRQLGLSAAHMTAAMNAAWLRHTLLGEDHLANSIAQEALRMSDRSGDLRARSQALALLGSVASRVGRWEQAKTQLQSAVDLALETGDVWLEAQHLAHLARAAIDNRDLRIAASAASRGAQLATRHAFEDLGADFVLMRAELSLAEEKTEQAFRLIQDLECPSPGPGEIRALAVKSRILRRLDDHDAAEITLELAENQVRSLLEPFGPSQALHAISTVPLFSDIARDWEKAKPTRRTIYGVEPTARRRGPVEQGQLLPVEVTVSRPADQSIAGSQERRRRRLLRILRELDAAGLVGTVDDLADVLSVSEKTVRRDLEALRQAGLDVRTRGYLK